MKRIIGLDIGGTKCAVVLAELGSTIVLRDRMAFATQTERGFADTKERLFATVRQMLDKHGLTTGDIAAIGVSCGGPLNSKEGVILCPPNLPGWVNIPFVKLLEETFGLPAFLQNDAKACALVEWKLGAGQGCRNMMFLTMGTGMGSGIIAEGQLVCGACDMGGEVGHIRIEDDGPLGFGKYGSFEGFTSGGGIARLAQQYAAKALEAGKPYAWGKTQEEIDGLTTKTVADFARQGDSDAKALFAVVGEKLGKGLSYFVDILNPEVIVIGSIFGRCEELLRPAMEAVLARECISFSLEACKVVPAQTGEQIGDLASIMVAVHGGGFAFELPAPPQVEQYRQELIARYPSLVPLAPLVQQSYQIIRDCFGAGGKLLCCGNGGSAADADHIVGELMKGFRLQRPLADTAWLTGCQHLAPEEAQYLAAKLQRALPAISLGQHTALSTAFGNDVAPNLIYAQQVLGSGRTGDVLVAISTSGNSENVVYAAKTAKALGMKVVAMTGPGASKLRRLADVCLAVPGGCTAEVQELHLPVYHALCSMLEASFFER